ncbi:MAG: putative hydrolase of the superfamily [Thermoleophilales bacterium]|nr:putative hydrolase of the superfamily [Thermoleophilales bacterium]
MKRAVICDFGGVLTTPLIESFLHYQEQSGVSFEEVATAMHRLTEKTGQNPLYELEKGLITEEEFRHSIEQEMGGGVDLSALSDLYFEHLQPNAPMIDFVRGLRVERGLRSALLTNNVREWEPKWRSMLPEIDEVFEIVVDSAFVGIRKPDPAIYELTVERLGQGVQASDCVFIDDIDVNIQTAEALGMTGVQFRSTEQAIADVEAALAG